MAADWKLVGADGGVKKTKHFCTVCPLQSDDAHQPNVEHCDRFCSERGDDWQCYHHLIISSDVQEELLQEVERLKVSIQLDLEIVSQRSKAKYYSNPSSHAQLSNKHFIHFIPMNDDDRDAFVDLLADKLILRRMSPTGGLEKFCQQLLQELIVEDKLCHHLDKLQHCNTWEACLILILHKIPCILHCENSVGIKLLTMLLIEGFSNAQHGGIFSQFQSKADHIQAFAERVQYIFSTSILGDDDGPAQWCLPMNGDGKNVGIICLDNNRIRKVIGNFELLVDVAVTDNARAIKYATFIPNYLDGIIIL